jgi:Tfp pilus assembly protein FimT
MTIVVALLAMMLAAASPAFAHTLATDEGDGVRSVAVAQDISGALGDVDRSQFGTATATDDSAAAADVSRSQGFTFVQFNSAVNDF